jgi:hypothetical protein
MLACAIGNASTPVILISVDTLRADHLGCHQAARKITSHIDSMARNGTLFSQVSSLVPPTLPSHVALFTSTCPFANGVEDNGVRLSPGQRLPVLFDGTLASNLRFVPAVFAVFAALTLTNVMTEACSWRGPQKLSQQSCSRSGSLKSTGVAKQSGLWRLGMDKPSLRITKWMGTIPVEGGCTSCAEVNLRWRPRRIALSWKSIQPRWRLSLSFTSNQYTCVRMANQPPARMVRDFDKTPATLSVSQ